MALSTFDPKKLTTIIAGAKMNGFADGTFVEIEELSDGVTSQAGADGEVMRVMSTDPRHRITITLQQGSSSNQVLSALRDADRVSHGSGAFPVFIQDLTGSTVFTASQAWIVKKPNASFSKQVESRAWVIETADAIFNLGGND